MPANASFDKGAAIEERTDQLFFRPIGLQIARAAFSTRLSPDHITLIALVTGLVAGRLCFYNDLRLNALGVLLFVVSDIFDSADGQLARMRRTSTRFGKILDGLSDGLRFANLYVQLIARLIVTGAAWWLAVPLGVAAGFAHAQQSGIVDTVRQLYLYVTEGGGGEFNLPEDMDLLPVNTAFARFQVRFYRGYLARYTGMLPNSMNLVREIRAGHAPVDIDQRWIGELSIVRRCAWIGQNIRFALLAVTVVPGYPAAFLWVTLIPMTIIGLLVVSTHERRAAMILSVGTPSLTPATS